MHRNATAHMSEPIDVRPEVARRFLKGLQAFHAEPNPLRAGGIAARQLQVLRQYQRPREKKLRLADVKEFLQMKDDGLD